MKIVLTKEESEKYFHTALCNAVSTGVMEGYGLELTYDKQKYKEAKAVLTLFNKMESPCIEDVWLQMLKVGDILTFTDVEGEGEMTSTITIKDVHRRVKLAPVADLLNMYLENDDAETADVILQTVFYKEVIFG